MKTKKQLQERVDFLEGLVNELLEQDEAQERAVLEAITAALDDTNLPYLIEGGVLYVSEDNPFDAAIKLIAAARDADPEPISIILSVEWQPAFGNEPSYYSGRAVVSG